MTPVASGVYPRSEGWQSLSAWRCCASESVFALKPFSLLLATVSTLGGFFVLAPAAEAATTYLVLGTYKQLEIRSKPQVSPYSSPSVQILPMDSIEQCEAAAQQISAKIYKPIQFFDGAWTCVEGK